MSFDAKRLESFDLLRLGLFACNKEGDILYANTAAQFLSGQSLKLLKERKLQYYLNSSDEWLANYRAHPEPSFLVPIQRPHPPGQHRPTTRHGNALPDRHFLRPPAEPIPVLVTIHPFPDDENILLAEIVPADKTLQMTRERHMNELSENTRRLLRNLAHEIKNPLGGIRGAAQLLEGELHDPENKEFTEVIISEADRLQHLVDKILAPYRQLYHPVPTNVHEILERVRLLVQSEFPEGLKVVRDYDISVPEMMADRGQLTQISLNLMRNAAEALSEQIAQGTACITLKTRVVHHVQVGQSFCRTALNIHVIDNGEGIPKELTDSIFYPLVSGKEQGSGLGLSLVQTFVEQHGGSISVSSEAGRTDFSILFPLSL